MNVTTLLIASCYEGCFKAKVPAVSSTPVAVIGLDELRPAGKDVLGVLRLRPGDLRQEVHLKRVSFPSRLVSDICNVKKFVSAHSNVP